MQSKIRYTQLNETQRQTHFSTSDPTTNDDSSNTSGNGTFQSTDIWYNTSNNTIFICTDATSTAAVWDVRNAITQKGTSFPISPYNEQFFYRSDEEILYMYSSDATAWIDVSTAGAGANDYLSALTNSVVSVTTTTALTSSAYGKLHKVTGTTSEYTITLPDPSSNSGKLIGFLGGSSSELTKVVKIAANGSENIGELDFDCIVAGKTLVLKSDGTDWQVIQRSNTLQANLTFNIDNSLTIADMNTYLNALPKNLNVNTLTIQFANGTYTWNSTIIVAGYENGRLNLYGNSSETSLAASKSVIIDNDGSTDVLNIGYNNAMIVVNYIEIEVDYTANLHAIDVYGCDDVQINSCAINMSQNNGGGVRYHSTNGYVSNLYITYGQVGVYSGTNSNISVVNCGNASNKPLYGGIAQQNSSIRYSGTMIEGSTADYTSDTGVYGSQNANDIPMNKNAVINGDMRISQKGTSFSTGNGTIYTLDRWEILASTNDSATATVTQSTDVPNNQFKNSMKIDVTGYVGTVNASDYYILVHSFEGYNFKKFYNQPAVLSFWIKSNKTGTMGIVSGYDTAGTYCYVSNIIITNTSWNKYSIPLIYDMSSGSWGTWANDLSNRIIFTFVAGSTYQTSSLDQWVSGNYYASTSQTNFIDNTANEIFITGVQLELGTIASNYEFLDYGTQLAQCQRYYYKRLTSAATAGLAHGFCYSSTSISYGVDLPVTMRVKPSLEYSGTFKADPQLDSLSTLLLSDYSNSDRCFIDSNDPTGLTVGDGSILISDADATSYIAFDAEL